MPQTSVAELEEEVARLRRELTEASERQSATDEVLRIIASSPADAQCVFDTIVRNFVSLCSSTFGAIYTFDGELVHFAGAHGFSPEQLNEIKAKYPVHADDRSVLSARAIRAKSPVHIQDTMVDPHYDRHHAVLMGSRRMLAMPMLREGVALGAIVAAWPDAGPTPKEHQDLLKMFAAQAVIAIENTRLLNELRESLQQQTATADVLKVISRSTFDLQTVLDTLTESAARLCETEMAAIVRPKGGAYYWATSYGFPPEYTKYVMSNPILPGRDTAVGRVLLENKIAHVPDVLADPEYGLKLGDFRSVLGIPLLREGTLIGVLLLLRRKARPFTDKQIELATTFADQAVIAIENVRLFDEVQARTRELSEALEQQTATAEVLRVISSSPGQLEPVFQAMLENAVRLCEAKFGDLYLRDRDGFRMVATHNSPPAYAAARRHDPLLRPPPDAPLALVATTKQVAHIPDITKIPSYVEGNPFVVVGVELGGYRTVLAVPMVKDNELVGAITFARQEVGLFTDRQIELVKNFAHQAVIAIDNTRLLTELRESLQQQTATADVLGVISGSPGELDPVFQAMLTNAVRVCEAKFGVLFRYNDNAFHAAAMLNVPPGYAEFLGRGSFQPDVEPSLAGSPLHRPLLSKEIVQSGDVLLEANPGPAAQYGGARSFIVVPLKKESELVGAFVIYRQEVRPYR